MTEGARARVDFLGLGFDPLDKPAVHAWLAGRGADDAFAYVVTPNVDHMLRLLDDPAVPRHAYEAADLILCDSRILARLARWCGVALPLVPGSDLTAELFARIVRPGDRIAVIGSDATTVAAVRARYPALEIVHHPAPMGLRRDDAARAAAARFIAETRPRFTLIAVGAPQQEMVAFDAKRLGAARGTALCIGASVDFLAGTQRRAPRLVQRLSLEWAWRLLTEPRRLWRRYLVEGPAIFPAVWRWRRGKRHTRSH